MAFTNVAWYYSFGDGATTGYYAVTKWATATVKNCGDIVRQNATPAAGSERCFVCIIGGTTNATTEPTWVLTRGAKTTDNTITWMEATGRPALNGDKTNEVTWLTLKNTAVTAGQLCISGDGTKILICTTSGTTGNGAEPTWAAYTTAGATTADGSAVWTTLKDLSNTYGAWASPFGTIVGLGGTNFLAGGDTVFSADNSAETRSAAVTATLATAAAKTTYIYSIDHTASLPPNDAARKSGASINITGAVGLTINPSVSQGPLFMEGFTFNLSNAAGTGGGTFNNTSGGFIYFRNCAFAIRASGNAILQITNNSGATTIWDNTTVSFAVAGQTLQISGPFYWKNTSPAVLGATIPTVLVTCLGGSPAFACLEGLDISNITTTLIGSTNQTLPSVGGLIKDCKINASAALMISTTVTGSMRTQSLRSDSGNTNYKMATSDYQGTLATETTIVRTGGATDGTTAVSWKLVTSANSEYYAPLKAPEIRIWNDKVGSAVTCTVFGIWGGGAVPFNDDIYMDVEYMGTASLPQGNFVSSGKVSSLATHAATGSDTSTWGAGSTTPFKMQVTFTAQQKGYITIRVNCATPSTTYYIDPKPVLS